MLYNENKINSYFVLNFKTQIESNEGEVLWELWINCLKENLKV